MTGVVDNVRYKTYMSVEDLLEKITSMNLEEAKNLGIPRRKFYRLRKASQKGKTIKLRNKTNRKICL